MLKRLSYVLPLVLLFAFLLPGQNPRHVVAQHPRLMLNDTVADTWEPGKSRLAAVVDRVMAKGNAPAAADFAVMLKGIQSSKPAFSNSSNDDANLNLLLNYAFSYLAHHRAGNDATANVYAEHAWAGMTNGWAPVQTITSITTDSKGLATVTLARAPDEPVTPGGYHFSVWGAASDDICGPVTVVSVPSPTTLTYQTGVKNASFTSGGMLGSTRWTGIDRTGTAGRALAQWSYFYDWCYDWLVANGHDQYARDQIKAGYWSSTPTRASSQFNDSIRESDFHNYAAWSGSAIIEAGIALHGDDPLAQQMLDEGAGYLWEGIKVQPAGCCADAYEYNLKKSVDVLTGGAMNWEGPTYWRSGTIRFLRAIEAFDSGTARRNHIWATQFADAKLAGMYKIYLRDPAGKMANFGDGGNAGGYAGRDNFGMAILNDRFPDAHFVWMMTHSPNDWNSGDSGETGLIYKLLFYPYVNGPGSHAPDDLPLAGQFGPDIILRSGWGPEDTFITYTSSLRGVYHRHDDAGSFTIYKHSPLVLGQPYTLTPPVYGNYNRRTIGGNTLTIYDPTDCWKDNVSTCGVDASHTKLVNDGGQLPSLRRFKNEFTKDEFQISRAWSGSLYTDAKHGALYREIDPVSRPLFALGASYEHIRHDLTDVYVNSHSGSGDNPHARVASKEGVIREFVHFQPSQGSLDPVVVFDRVTATSPALKKSWLVHIVNPPVVNGAASHPGDTIYDAAQTTETGNGEGRLWISHLLPANAKVRAVGGDACTPVPIRGATNAKPAVYYAPGHGLKDGEPVGMMTGTQPLSGGGPSYWPSWLIDRYFGAYAVGKVIDADHFTIESGIASDSTRWAPWETAFTNGDGPPRGSGGFAGQVYYQRDAAKGYTLWQWDGKTWVHLDKNQGIAQGFGHDSPVIYSHASCNWAYYVDQFGPAGSGGAHLWNGSMDGQPEDARPNWLIQQTPAGGHLTDYFLNVLTAAGSRIEKAPEAVLIQSEGVYGAQIADRAGAYIAVFATATNAVSLHYAAAHAGPATHVAAGLNAGMYRVTRNGTAIDGTFATDSAGAISFRETGGGDFLVAAVN